jgi:putative transposase
MPSTHTSLHYHVIFSTKNREPWINAEWENDLFGYMGGCVRTLGAVPEKVGGTDDHVHLLVGMKPTICLSDFVEKLKPPTSDWVSRQMRIPRFKWQIGYGGFTVSPTQRPAVVKYIERQRAHHRRKSFKEEYIEFLRRYGVEFKEQYLW